MPALPVYKGDAPPLHTIRKPANDRRHMWSLRWYVALLLVFSIATYFISFHHGSSTFHRMNDEVTTSRKDIKNMIQLLPSNFLPETGKHRHNGRLVVVGDVHGMKHSLVSLLSKMDFNRKHDHLILAGDMISKGPDSKGVVDLIMKIGATAVRGNHEDQVLIEYARMTDANVTITEDGEDVTTDEEPLLSAGNHKDRKLVKALGHKRLRWLKSCPIILKVGELEGMGNVIVVHAGLVPGVRLEKQDPETVMNIRTISKDGKPRDDHDGRPWTKAWHEYQKSLQMKDRTMVIYGHDARLGLQEEKYSIGIDTRCQKGGKLTAVVIEGGFSVHKYHIVHVGCKA
ncbi:Metallo-dependent phosphatase-like protein [Calycina marina]|uniref:Metallo-dependent phosphatase-like protein n=1 Tax=Calycina marina TaxID=1763456 RepID=A0A9P7Z4R4_9HELO|nr:Metallo-dependent phosphatase-like protein [Calycina marina]